MSGMQKNYRFIGKPAPRKDALDIVTGRAQYIGDMKQPDMLYGKVLRSPLQERSTLEDRYAPSCSGARP